MVEKAREIRMKSSSDFHYSRFAFTYLLSKSRIEMTALFQARSKVYMKNSFILSGFVNIPIKLFVKCRFYKYT